MPDTAQKSHRWRFHRLGGFDQVRLDTGADILALEQLDPKLWAALSCPTQGLAFDVKTLELLDLDKDGRIRVPEILAAAQWIGSLLKNPDDLAKASPTLALSAIDDRQSEGKTLLASARQILANLGKKDAAAITAEDTADLQKKIFAGTRFNGDGIVPPEAAEDESVQAVIKQILERIGGTADRSGAQGVSQAHVDEFFAEAQAFSDWYGQAENPDSGILVLKDATAAAVVAFEDVQPKVDDYLTRCELALFDHRAAVPLSPGEADYKTLAARELSSSTEALLALPLAQVVAGATMPLSEGLNPAWASRLARLRDLVVTPLLGDRSSLSQADWTEIKQRLAPYQKWHAAKKGAKVEPLGQERIREILASGAKEAIASLIAQDKVLTAEADAIASVDRLVRYHRDLFTLLNNFVTFRDFYSRKTKAVFQAGTLYLDRRSCDLCVRVDDLGKHSALAGRSGTFLAYCECTRKGTPEKMTIAAAFTSGDSDNLMVGRNGVFYDRKHQDWDATIVKIVDHPISVRQAFWSPYKRLGRMLGEQAEKFAAAKDQAVTTQQGAGIAAAATAAEAGKAPAAPPFDVGKFAGIFAAIGLAIGAIGTAVAAVMTGFLGLKWWQMPLSLIGLILVISGPAMILAWLKLRTRNLAPILDANGWAVNTLAKINIPFGTSMTRMAELPEGSERSLLDPYAEKKQPWKLYLFLAVPLAALGFLWQKGYLEQWYEQYWPLKPAAQTQTTGKPPETAPAAAEKPPAEKPPAEKPPAP